MPVTRKIDPEVLLWVSGNIRESKRETEQLCSVPTDVKGDHRIPGERRVLHRVPRMALLIACTTSLKSGSQEAPPALTKGYPLVGGPCL